MGKKYPIYFLIGNMIYKKFYFIYKPFYFLYKYISDRKKISIIKKTIKPGMKVIDVGANIGFYSILFSKLVGEDGKVYAFEPDKENFCHLEKNCHSRRNITINKMAVSDKGGKIKLYISSELNVDHSTYDDGEGRKFIEIDAISLDDYIKKDEKIDFIKIDIQGYDYYAVLGSQNLINRINKIVVLTEFWPYGLNKAGVKPIQYLELLKNLNFKIDINNKDSVAAQDKINDKMFSLDFFAYKN